MTLVQSLRNVVQRNAAMQSVDQRHAVQGGTLAPHRQRNAQGSGPSAELGQRRIGQVVDQVRMQAMPKRPQARQGVQSIYRTTGQVGGIQGTCGSADQNLKRKMRLIHLGSRAVNGLLVLFSQQLRQGL